MGSIDEQILRATKEIVVKFIEAGRISPTGFHETFKDIYNTVENAVKKNEQSGQPDKKEPDKKDKKRKGEEKQLPIS